MKLKITLTNSEGTALVLASQIPEAEEMVYEGGDEKHIADMLTAELSPQIIGLIRLFREAEKVNS